MIPKSSSLKQQESGCGFTGFSASGSVTAAVEMLAAAGVSLEGPTGVGSI